jgi:hypothetical protein
MFYGLHFDHTVINPGEFYDLTFYKHKAKKKNLLKYVTTF